MTATLETEAKLPVHYTLDGSAPTVASPVYREPLVLAVGTRLRAASLLGSRVLSGGYDRQVTTAEALTRASFELATCATAPMSIDDDYPAKGVRARFLITGRNPCWRWDDAPLEGVAKIALRVGQVPLPVHFGSVALPNPLRRPATPEGEFEIRNGCGGPKVATLPLAPAAQNPGVTRLVSKLDAVQGTATLCITYTGTSLNPIWAIERVELLPWMPPKTAAAPGRFTYGRFKSALLRCWTTDKSAAVVSLEALSPPP